MRRGVLGGIAGAAGFLLTGCHLLSRQAEFRFRMTVEVSTGQGIRHGSSVYRVIANADSFKLGDVSGKSVGLEGEATMVDLPTGLLFVLLARPKAGGPLASAVTAALFPPSSRNSDGSLVDAILGIDRWAPPIKADLPRKNWPTMVRFGDLADPRTVEIVEPELVGVSRISLETTQDEVSIGIRSKLPWLSDRGKPLANDGSRPPSGERPAYEKLGQGLFKMGSWQ